MNRALPESITSAQAARLADFIEQGGDLDALLNLSHLATPEMRPLSSLAVKHSGDYTANFLPHTLVFQLAPRAKRLDERVDVQLITGKAQLFLGTGTVGGSV